VTASAYTWLAALPAGLREASPDYPRHLVTLTPEVHHALDVIENDPRLGDRDPAALGAALVHGDAASRERVAALLYRLGKA
jgi:hypothetical protein